jgi:hypothetical protein
MRHVLLPRAIATGTRGVIDATAPARLVAFAGCLLRATPGFLCAGSGAIDLATVAAVADEHLRTAAPAQEQPGRRGLSPLAVNAV